MDAFQDLNNLFFFARVVDCGSYTSAAEALGMQTSKLSRRIGALERELGVRLLNRTTRKLSLTAVIRSVGHDPGGQSRARRRLWTAPSSHGHRAHAHALDGATRERAYLAFCRR
jgi:hypothetical protein